MENSEKQTIVDLLGQGQNTEYAALLVRNWLELRYHAELSFWQELKAVAQTTHEVFDHGLFDENRIYTMLWGKRNRNPWYGLTFPIATFGGTEVTFKIERNEGPMYYGLLNVAGTGEETKKIMSAAIQRFGMVPSESWTGSKDTDAKLDFENFNHSPATQQLANRDKRQVVIGSLWAEIMSFITEANEALRLSLGETYQPLPLKS